MLVLRTFKKMFYIFEHLPLIILCLVPVRFADNLNQDNIHDMVNNLQQDGHEDLVHRMDMEEKSSDNNRNISRNNYTGQKRGQGQLVSTFLDETVPEKFLENFRNPCWMDEYENKLQCLPYFYLIDLSGTSSDLHKVITLHPLIFDAKLKAPGFWHSQRYKACCNSLDFYTSLFEKATSMIRLCTSSRSSTDPTSKCRFQSIKSLHDDNYHPGITLDPSPDTLYFDFATHQQLIQFGEGKLLPNEDNYNPELLHRIHPDARFVVMLQNPVNRLYEVYNKQFKTPSPGDFSTKVLIAIEWFISCKKRKGPTSEWCLFMVGKMNSKMAHFVTEMQKGFYYSTINRWAELFGEDQFKIFKYEDYIRDRVDYLESIFNFLDTKPFKGLKTAVKQFRSEETPKSKPMWNSTKHLLHALYQPFNHKLSHFMDDNRFRYSDRAGCSLKVEKLFDLV